MQGQEDCCRFKTSMICIVNPRPAEKFSKSLSLWENDNEGKKKKNTYFLCPRQEVRPDGKMYMKEVLLACGVLSLGITL